MKYFTGKKNMFFYISNHNPLTFLTESAPKSSKLICAGRWRFKNMTSSLGIEPEVKTSCLMYSHVS